MAGTKSRIVKLKLGRKIGIGAEGARGDGGVKKLTLKKALCKRVRGNVKGDEAVLINEH